MSQAGILNNTGGGGSGVSSVIGSNGITVTPTTGNVVVSGVNATTSTVGVASFNPVNFTVTSGQVSLLGTSVTETLTPNSGGAVSPVSGNINNQGLAANSGGNAYPLFSYNGGAGQLNWENRAFLSTYVVDTNVTDGAKGTFSTLAAAINQAIVDGATGNAGLCIYLRNCTITETISISTNSINLSILGTGGKSYEETSTGNPIFNGSFTYSGNGQILFSNVDFSASATIVNSGSGVFVITDCSNSAAITQSGSNGMFLNNSSCYSNTSTFSGGNTVSYNTIFSGGTMTFSNSASLAVYYGTIGTTITGSASAISFNNTFVQLAANTLSAGTLINYNSIFGGFNYYGNSSVTYEMGNTTAGNTYQAKRSAISYAVLANDDYYIGITNTSADRTVTLPSTGVLKNQSFIIKDESGAAGTNNISVTVNGGTKTIDGVTTYAISTNYGAIQVIYDGTNYFTF